MDKIINNEARIFNETEAKQLLKEAVERCADGDQSLRVLEAGGGSASRVPLPGKTEITTIDIDASQLERNKTSSKVVHGDIQTYEWSPNSFDAVICHNVLEHVPAPDQALQKLEASLDEGGLFIVRGPILNSARSVVILLTPHFVHVLFYRYILNMPNAGKPGYAPFKTAHHVSAEYFEMAQFLSSRGYDEVMTVIFQSNQVLKLKNKSRLGYRIFLGFGKLLKPFMPKGFETVNTDFVFVYRKRAAYSQLKPTIE